MSFTAHLQGLKLPDVLQLVSLSKQSGVATVIHSGASAKIVFSTGRVIYASSDTQNRLGYSLVKRRIITEGQLGNALDLQRQRDDNMPLASILVKQGVVDPVVLEKETKIHIRNVFSDVLKWDTGIFFFEPHDLSGTLTVLRRGLSVESLLIEAAVNQDTDSQIDSEICDFWR